MDDEPEMRSRFQYKMSLKTRAARRAGRCGPRVDEHYHAGFGAIEFGRRRERRTHGLWRPTLHGRQYRKLSKGQKGIVRRFPGRVTGLGRAQVRGLHDDLGLETDRPFKIVLQWATVNGGYRAAVAKIAFSDAVHFAAAFQFGPHARGSGDPPVSARSALAAVSREGSQLLDRMATWS